MLDPTGLGVDLLMLFLSAGNNPAGRIEDDDTPDNIMARYNRATLEEVFLDVARGRVQESAS